MASGTLTPLNLTDDQKELAEHIEFCLISGLASTCPQLRGTCATLPSMKHYIRDTTYSACAGDEEPCCVTTGLKLLQPTCQPCDVNPDRTFYDQFSHANGVCA